MDLSFDQALLGFRLWTVDPDGVLQSLVVGQDWQPGANRAICTKGWYERKRGFSLRRHRVPARRCQCGFHAYHRLEDVWEHARGLKSGLGLDCVLGAVAGWGDLQIHPDGFRSQWAEILALATPSDLDQALSLFLAAERYETSILSVGELGDPNRYHGVQLAPHPPRDGRSIRGGEE